MKYIFAALVTLGLIIFLLAVIYLAVSRIIRHYKNSHAIWEVRHKDLYNGQVQLWIERGPSTDLWTKVDASTDSFLYEYSRLEDACNERNATRKALHL
jgi:hypothetical protein